MDSKIMNRLRGYDRHFKGRFLFLHRKILSDGEFILWDLSFSTLADWDDKNHDPKEYGSFNFLQTEIAYLLGCSKTKVSNNARKLISLGLWIKREGRIFVNGFDIRDNFAQLAKEKKVIDLQDYISVLKPSISKTQPQVSNSQRQTPKGNGVSSPKIVSILKQSSPKRALVSSKSEYKSDEEYQRYWEEIGCPANFDISDMKWIDRNV